MNHRRRDYDFTDEWYLNPNNIYHDRVGDYVTLKEFARYARMNVDALRWRLKRADIKPSHRGHRGDMWCPVAIPDHVWWPEGFQPAKYQKVIHEVSTITNSTDV